MVYCSLTRFTAAKMIGTKNLNIWENKLCYDLLNNLMIHLEYKKIVIIGVIWRNLRKLFFIDGASTKMSADQCII